MKFFISKPRKRDIKIRLFTAKNFAKHKPAAYEKQRFEESGFSGKKGQIAFMSNKSGAIESVCLGISDSAALYDLSGLVKSIQSHFDSKVIKSISFSLDEKDIPKIKGGAENLCAGWGLACYNYDKFKKFDSEYPALVFPKAADKKRVTQHIESAFLIRDLINTPANHMGPAEIEKAVRKLAKEHEAKVKVIGDKVLEKDFPLIFAVGDSSPRRPRLIDMTWGNEKHPKITLVGKGVCFDTGGLDLKPSPAMALMKKDMGGAAHVLGVAGIIMGLALPIRLRVLIPAVENAVSGASFRPGDVFKSRKGLTVENTNTDAEGRLILADTLTYACEEKPELVIDFATLTGSARAALGHDIPPFFTNDDKIMSELKETAMNENDPLWPMPLWTDYHPLIESSVADLVNSAKIPGDLIYSALFLQKFLLHETPWIHLDVYAWQNSGSPGKPAGGTDMGLRAITAFLEKRYRK